MPASVTRTTAALLAAAALAACGGAPRGAPRSSPSPSSAPAGQTQGQVAAIAEARADSARHPYTSADIDFMSSMIGHHAQAIQMARLAPTHGANPSIRVLADRIINAQRDEIATMQRWLRDRLQPVPEVDSAGSVSGASAMHGAHTGQTGHAAHGDSASMPGMLTPAQMRELDAARGTEFDRLFLVYMIQHHRGATAMVKQLFGTYGAGQDESVFKLATDVNVDQETEIARMEKMLLALVLGESEP
jgi:uncharacterized protein (DUF305 family)